MLAWAWAGLAEEGDSVPPLYTPLLWDGSGHETNGHRSAFGFWQLSALQSVQGIRDSTRGVDAVHRTCAAPHSHEQNRVCLVEGSPCRKVKNAVMASEFHIALCK